MISRANQIAAAAAKAKLIELKTQQEDAMKVSRGKRSSSFASLSAVGGNSNNDNTSARRHVCYRDRLRCLVEY